MDRWQDWHERRRDTIRDVNRVVTVFEVDLEGPPGGRLNIKILEGADGRFSGVTNFRVQALGASDPYTSSHPQDSVDDAFWDALTGLLMWGKDAFWIINESY